VHLADDSEYESAVVPNAWTKHTFDIAKAKAQHMHPKLTKQSSSAHDTTAGTDSSSSSSSIKAETDCVCLHLEASHNCANICMVRSIAITARI
jgi:BRCT domain type II-containing protein